jgi:glyoxylase-like metal-dependent hydrolase (beta-lactamase superfamily II)
MFLAPQSVSALDISGDGRFIAVTTMAFRHDRNLWLISAEGKLLWGHYLSPWAPFEVAVLPGARAFGVGLAYSGLTAPYPTISLFESVAAKQTAFVDAGGQLGWLRYGAGDWRTGWVASIIGDLVVRNHESVFTVPAEDCPWRLSADGSRRAYPLTPQRPFRMVASEDGEFLALGYITADPNRMDEKTRRLLNVSSVVLALRRPSRAEASWSAGPVWDAPMPSRLPEPAVEFPALAESFHMRPDTVMPFRVAASVAVNRHSSRVAITEYGGWLWVRNSPAIGSWDPPYHAIPFLPRQRGWLRIFEASGRETVRTALPEEGLFDVRMDHRGDVFWCVPTKWFARGTAGCAWLPTDRDADTLHAYDLTRRSWRAPWQFPDAVSDVAVHPKGAPALVSCWDGRLYLLDANGRARVRFDAGGPAVVSWSGDGRFGVAGTAGEVLRINGHGELGWRVTLPAVDAEPLKQPLDPVFDEVPIYSVGRVGPEHAYVGDMWLIKTSQGGILVDAGGSSSIPFTWAKMKAAGIEPKKVRYLMHTHSHGDHTGAGYLWRAMGLKIVAAESAAFSLSWLMPMLSDYGVWVPRPLDLPLPLKRIGDETEITLCGLRIRALFVPGHTADSVVYMMELNGRRVAFTGDIGFDAKNNILDRCWGDREKAKEVMATVRSSLIPWRPEFVFTGHSALRDGTQFLQRLVEGSEESLEK